MLMQRKQTIAYVFNYQTQWFFLILRAEQNHRTQKILHRIQYVYTDAKQPKCDVVNNLRKFNRSQTLRAVS